MKCAMPQHPRTLYVHVGPPKTGTSAIQHILRSDRIANLAYPRSGQWWDGAHHNLVFNYYPNYSRPDMTSENIDELFSAIGEEARNGANDMLISSEAFWKKDVSAFIGDILPYLGAEFERVEIIAVCREHFSFAASVYGQMLKDVFFSEQRPPDTFLLESASDFTYAQPLDKLCAGPYQVRVINYHPASNFVRRFFDHVSPSASPELVEVRNASLSTKGMVALLCANQVAENSEARDQLYDLLKSVVGFVSRSDLIFSAAAARAVFDRFSEDRNYLEKNGIFDCRSHRNFRMQANLPLAKRRLPNYFWP